MSTKTKSAKDCDKCAVRGSDVKDVRCPDTGRHVGVLQRRRECVKCGKRWTTVEIRREEYEELLKGKPE